MDNQKIISFLKEFVSEQRFSLFQEKLNERTRYASVLIENVYQSHNASAIIRTCEALGFQDVYVFERKNNFAPNDEIALGAEKWLNIHKYQASSLSLIQLIDKLKNNDYRIIATTLHHKSTSLYEFNIMKGKCIFMFGTEKEGLSDEAISLADEYIKIPVYGFTESFNVSVSVGIILSHIAQELRKNCIHYSLSPKEKEEILIQWLVQSIPSGKKILERFLQQTI
ncbi:MAG: RNA methyltransferase [Bacteroidales bacterium]|nr:RNA methyltransferase [Bacteroidales bacterium]